MPELSLPNLSETLNIQLSEGIATSSELQSTMEVGVLYIDWTKTRNGNKHGLCGCIKLKNEDEPIAISMSQRQLSVNGESHYFVESEKFDTHKDAIETLFRNLWESEQKKPKGTIGQVDGVDASAVMQKTRVSDMYSYEEATTKPEHFDKITQATTGDAHGSVVKVLFKCLHDLGCQMEKDPWDKLVALCRTMPDDLDFGNIKLSGPYNAAVWENTCKQIFQALEQCLKLKLINQKQHDFLQSLYKAVTTVVTIEPRDKDANVQIKQSLENLVIGNAEITFPLFENLINEQLKNSVGKLWDDSLSTVEKEKIKKKLGRFIGDVFGDRGPNDALMGIVFRQLKALGIPITLIIGNHDLELINAFEKFQENSNQLCNRNIGKDQSGSLVRMNILCNANDGVGVAGVTYKSVRQLYDDVLVPQFKVLDYSVGLKDGKEHLTLFSHAPTKPSIIWKAAYRLGMVPLKPLKQCGVKDFIKMIDFVNQEASMHLKAGNFVATLCDGQLENSGDGIDALDGNNPFDCFFWRRDKKRDDDALLSEALAGYACVSGHTPEGRPDPDVDLDNDVLKGKAEYENQDFTVWASSDAHSRSLSDTKVEGIDYEASRNKAEEILIANAQLFVKMFIATGSKFSGEVSSQKSICQDKLRYEKKKKDLKSSELIAKYLKELETYALIPNLDVSSIESYFNAVENVEVLKLVYLNRTDIVEETANHQAVEHPLITIDPAQEVISETIKAIIKNIDTLYTLVNSQSLPLVQKRNITMLLTQGIEATSTANTSTYYNRVFIGILTPIILFVNALRANDPRYNNCYKIIAEINVQVQALGYTDKTMPLWLNLKSKEELKAVEPSIPEDEEGDVVIEDDEEELKDEKKNAAFTNSKIKRILKQAINLHAFSSGLLKDVSKKKQSIKTSVESLVNTGENKVDLTFEPGYDGTGVGKKIDHYELKVTPKVASTSSVKKSDSSENLSTSLKPQSHTIMEIHEKKISVPKDWKDGFGDENKSKVHDDNDSNLVKPMSNLTKMAKIALDTYIKTSGAEPGEGKKTIRLSGSDPDLRREIERLIAFNHESINVDDHDKYDDKGVEKKCYGEYLSVAPTLNRAASIFQGVKKQNENRVNNENTRDINLSHH